MRHLTITLAALASAAACHPAGARAALGGEGATLTTDSLEYGVSQAGGLYQAAIGFTYTNRTDTVLSVNYCRVPGPPTLEKRVDGQWVRAYDAVRLLCLAIPPFRLPAGESYHADLRLAVGVPGANVFPQLDVDSIPGVYRLRWALHVGPNPDATDTTMVQAISNEFRLVLR